jgi:hypothetical protein
MAGSCWRQLTFLLLVSILSLQVNGDGVEITVVNPSPGATLVSPVAVSLNLELTAGVGADKVRIAPSLWNMCYALDGDRPPLTIPIQSDSKWENIPVLDDARLKPGTTHLFEAWLCMKGGEESEVYGYTKHNFFIKQKLSAHHIRVTQWQEEVKLLISSPLAAPVFIEIGTSFFNTLAQEHAKPLSSGGGYEDDGWMGLSVEPIIEYLNMLPVRQGLAKVNAMVCPDNEERTIYTFQGLSEVKLTP